MKTAPDIALPPDPLEEIMELHASTMSVPRARLYRRVWRRWRGFLGAVDPARASVLHVTKFWKLRAEQEGAKPRHGGSSRLSGGTLIGELSAMRKLYEVFGDQRVVDANPFKVFRPGKEFSKERNRKRETELTPFEKVPEILNLPNSTPSGIMKRAFLCAFYGGGLRISEVIALRMVDIVEARDADGAYCYLRLHDTKSGDDRKQALLSGMSDPIMRYWRQRRGEGAADSDAFFVLYSRRRRGSNGMSINAARRLFKRLCREVGLPASITPHSARATAITKLLAEGLGHREVQDFSRHSSVTMVEGYDKRAFGVERAPARKVGF